MSKKLILITMLTAIALTMMSTGAQATQYHVYVADSNLCACGGTNEGVSEYRSLGGPLSLLAPPAIAQTRPIGVAITHDGRYVYVANEGSGSLSQYSVQGDGTLMPLSTPTVVTGAEPDSIAIANVSPLLHYAYVDTSVGIYEYQIEPNGELTSLSPPKVSANPNGEHSIAVTRDGRYAYVTTQSSVLEYSIAAANGQLTQIGTVLTAGSDAWGVAVTDDGKYVYVTDIGNKAISEFKIASDGTLTTIGAYVFASTQANGIVAVTAPSGTDYVDVTNMGSAKVSEFEVLPGGSLAEIGSIPTEQFPFDIAATPDGRYVYVPNGESNSISQYEVGANGLLVALNPKAAPAGTEPRGIAVAEQLETITLVSDATNTLCVNPTPGFAPQVNGQLNFAPLDTAHAGPFPDTGQACGKPSIMHPTALTSPPGGGPGKGASPYSSALSGASWVGIANESSDSKNLPPKYYIYDAKFYLCENQVPEAEITGQMFADNAGGVFLNGVPLGHQPFGLPFENHENFDGTPFTFASYAGFEVGLNTLQFVVYDESIGSTAIDFNATIVTPACPHSAQKSPEIEVRTPSEFFFCAKVGKNKGKYAEGECAARKEKKGKPAGEYDKVPVTNCVEVGKKKGDFSDGACTKRDEKKGKPAGSFELCSNTGQCAYTSVGGEATLSTPAFGNNNVTCKANTDTGEITGGFTDTDRVTFTGCEFLGLPCQSAGPNSTPSGKAGVIITNLLDSRLVGFPEKYTVVNQAFEPESIGPKEGEVWDKLVSSEHEPFWSEFECGGVVFVRTQGSDAGAYTAGSLNHLSISAEVNFEDTHGQGLLSEALNEKDEWVPPGGAPSLEEAGTAKITY
jgi:6-phosphogluconolactonase (cycloisomerase 2 family)